MLSRLMLATICALCLQGSPSFADGDQPSLTAATRGRFTLCIEGFVETRMGCLRQGSTELTTLAITTMRACMAGSAGSMQGYRARYLWCLQMQPL